MSRVVGIDPGVNGAVAFIDGTHAEVYDIPTIWVKKGKGRRQVYDLPTFWEVLITITARAFVLSDGAPLVIVEDVHAMPGQGVTSMFSMGYGIGVIHGFLTASRQPFELVTPQRWKKEMLTGTQKDKKAAYIVASRLFPGIDLGRRSDQGRAEALLIAEYGRRASS